MNDLLLRRREMIAIVTATINWDLFAVQTLDSTMPNYNPAVAIILNNNNYGTVTSNGKWYLTKVNASSIAAGSMFKGVTAVTDTNGIIIVR